MSVSSFFPIRPSQAIVVWCTWEANRIYGTAGATFKKKKGLLSDFYLVAQDCSLLASQVFVLFMWFHLWEQTGFHLDEASAHSIACVSLCTHLVCTLRVLPLWRSPCFASWSLLLWPFPCIAGWVPLPFGGCPFSSELELCPVLLSEHCSIVSPVTVLWIPTNSLFLVNHKLLQKQVCIFKLSPGSFPRWDVSAPVVLSFVVLQLCLLQCWVSWNPGALQLQMGCHCLHGTFLVSLLFGPLIKL